MGEGAEHLGEEGGGRGEEGRGEGAEVIIPVVLIRATYQALQGEGEGEGVGHLQSSNFNNYY